MNTLANDLAPMARRRRMATSPKGVLHALLTAGTAAAVLGSTADARASNALDSPEAGVVQVGRGGAWLARADDAMAAYFNPAAMVTQGHAVTLGATLMIRSHCMDRRDVTGQRPSPGAGLAPPADEVCADIPPFPNPHIAATFRLHERVALGVAVVAPHAAGSVQWPAVLEQVNRFGVEAPHPSPQRYLLLEASNLMLFPTLSLGVAATEELSFGAGFVWGIAAIDFANMTEATSSERGVPQPDDFTNDIRAQVTGVDGFIPGFVVSTLWNPIEEVGISGWFRWSDAVRAELDMYAEAPYYTQGGTVSDSPDITDEEGAGSVKMPIPMEARLGFRYRHPRDDGVWPEWTDHHEGRIDDPLSQDWFDIELDLTWANNSAVDVVEVRFNPGVRIQGTPGFAPQNADIPHQWRDTLGIRLGGDVVVVPDTFALRAGAFFESSAAQEQYLNIDFHVAERIGWGGGGTVRVGPVDLSVAYQHTYFGDIDNGGQGEVLGISGDQNTAERTRQAVNGGSASSSLNEVALGGTLRF